MSMASSICFDLLDFINASPTPFHAVLESILRLKAKGFSLLSEQENWSSFMQANGNGLHLVTRGETALVAFAIPQNMPIQSFRIIGAHTDSPNLRLKPNATYSKEGYQQLSVEVYGGALLNSWLDRDLSLAGRVLCKKNGRLESHLVRLDNLLVRIPQLAIHLDREVNERGLIVNKQDHLNPIVGLSNAGFTMNDLHSLCAKSLGVLTDSVIRVELMLHDAVPATLGGFQQEFIFAPRLDNLGMCHAALTALVESIDDVQAGVVPLVVLFDHEEVGSESAYGAGSPLLLDVMERLVYANGDDKEKFYQVLARSFCVSADMAHAVHPNYPDRHDARHRPMMNAGPVIKFNSQQRYATSIYTAALFEACCKQAGVPVQTYSHRSDLPCGSTIGPITASRLGIRTVDVGNAMVSMHSVREMAGSQDPTYMSLALTKFLQGTQA